MRVPSRRAFPSLLCFALLGVVGCEKAAPHCPPAAPAACPSPASPAPPPTPVVTAVQPTDEESPAEKAAERKDQARFYPGADIPRGERTRKPNVVILFAPPGPRMEEAALYSVDVLRLQPVYCVLQGKLAFGARCGEAMPARTKVRLSESSYSIEELEVERSARPFRDENGNKDYPAPYGPACCMYNTCAGKTVPYYPKLKDGQATLTTTKTVLAIWPADAELDLTVFTPGVPEELKLDEAPWKSLPCKQPARCLVQASQLGNRSYASTNERSLSAALLFSTGASAPWQELRLEHSPREYYLLAGTDLDHDGKPELLVYARWANDYGLHVLANDAPQPAYQFSCGNI